MTSKPTIGMYTLSPVLASTVEALADSVDAVVFRSGEQMLDWLGHEEPGFVMLDIDIPAEWSMAMKVLARGTSISPNTRFAVTTWRPEGARARQAGDLGAFTITPKPLSSQAMLDVMDAALDSAA